MLASSQQPTITHPTPTWWGSRKRRGVEGTCKAEYATSRKGKKCDIVLNMGGRVHVAGFRRIMGLPFEEVPFHSVGGSQPNLAQGGGGMEGGKGSPRVCVNGMCRGFRTSKHSRSGCQTKIWVFCGLCRALPLE